MINLEERELVAKTYRERLKEVASLGLPLDQYVVCGSGSLAIRGLREDREIDILVSDTLWEMLVERLGDPQEDEEFLSIGSIRVWRTFILLLNQKAQVIVDSEMNEGLPFMKLSYVIQWKKWLGRAQDQVDIELIERYLFASVSPI